MTIRIASFAKAEGGKALRKNKRSRAILQGQIICSAGTIKVRISSLSATGARVKTTVPIPPDCDLMLTRGELFVASCLVWTDGAYAGPKFYRNVSPEDWWRPI